jgi:hypothetical protein
MYRLHALMATLLCLTAAAHGADDALVVHPAADDTLLINPGKGFVQYYGADKAYTKDYIAIGYTRPGWCDMEPAEGKFDWRPLDSFIDQFKRYGKKIAFAVMSVSTGYGHEYVTPKWVFDAGAEPLAIPDASSKTGKQIIPRHWTDPVFLRKLADFIKAFGARYDGNPDIAFLDIRDYGNWGEGHIGMLGNDPDIILTPPDNLREHYFKPYVDAFPHTQLIIPWGSNYYDAVYDWCVSLGAGMRRDGILSQWSKDGSECARAFGHSPAVFEYCDSYANTKKNGYWSTDGLMKYVQAGKPSYMQWDPQIFKENREFILKLGNRIGYHFVLQEATLPSIIHAGAPCALRLRWLNDGVAYCYERCSVALALLDRDDHVVQRQWLTESRPNAWKPDEPVTEALTATFTDVPAGDYKLAVGLFLDPKAAAPAYRLGIQGRTAEGWYVLSDDAACRP